MSGRRLRNPTFLLGVALMTLVCTSAWPEATTKPAVPLDPIDGILAVAEQPATTSAPVTLVVNWPALLRK